MTHETVEQAGSTPDAKQPFAELGLKDEEYQQIRHILGRRPTATELAMYSVMWSEHCSYKSSKVHLRQFGEKAPKTPRSASKPTSTSASATSWAGVRPAVSSPCTP